MAGITAAIDNDIGVIGVGLQIDLYTYKVLNRNGSGFLSDVIEGIAMTSLHVAGVAALLLTQTAKCDSDLSGSCSPAEVQTRLEATAKDLGTSGKDSQYGSGLVDAYGAITQ